MIDLIVGVGSCILGFIGARLLDDGFEEDAPRDPREGTPFT